MAALLGADQHGRLMPDALARSAERLSCVFLDPPLTYEGPCSSPRPPLVKSGGTARVEDERPQAGCREAGAKANTLPL